MCKLAGLTGSLNAACSLASCWIHLHYCGFALKRVFLNYFAACNLNKISALFSSRVLVLIVAIIILRLKLVLITSVLNSNNL